LSLTLNTAILQGYILKVDRDEHKLKIQLDHPICVDVGWTVALIKHTQDGKQVHSSGTIYDFEEYSNIVYTDNMNMPATTHEYIIVDNLTNNTNNEASNSNNN